MEEVFLIGRAEESEHRFLCEFQWEKETFSAVYHEDRDFHPRCKVGRFPCRWKFVLNPESTMHKNTNLKAVFFEIEHSESIFRRLRINQVINVTDLSVEEIASRVVESTTFGA